MPDVTCAYRAWTDPSEWPICASIRVAGVPSSTNECLVRVTQAVRCQARCDRQPARVGPVGRATATGRDAGPRLARHGHRLLRSRRLSWIPTRGGRLEQPRGEAVPPPVWCDRRGRCAPDVAEFRDGRPGTAAANASRAPCLAVRQIPITVERSTPAFSAASRWVACWVRTCTKISYFSDGASRRRGLPDLTGLGFAFDLGFDTVLQPSKG